jgi:hypothetical protein
VREHPDHHDAELLLRLYELRRDETLRQARQWAVGLFHADSADDLLQRYPYGSKENAFFRMAVSYWDMAASIVNHGLIKEEFFFENNSEFWFIWEKIRHLMPGLREARRNPLMYHNLEALAGKYETWLERHAPGALEVARQRVKKIRIENPR